MQYTLRNETDLHWVEIAIATSGLLEAMLSPAQHCGRRELTERGPDPVGISVDAETEHKLNNCSYGVKSQLFFWPIGFLSQLTSLAVVATLVTWR